MMKNYYALGIPTDFYALLDQSKNSGSQPMSILFSRFNCPTRLFSFFRNKIIIQCLNPLLYKDCMSKLLAQLGVLGTFITDKPCPDSHPILTLAGTDMGLLVGIANAKLEKIKIVRRGNKLTLRVALRVLIFTIRRSLALGNRYLGSVLRTILFLKVKCSVFL